MFKDYKERKRQEKEYRERAANQARLVSLNKEQIDDMAYEIYKYACDIYDKFQEEYRCTLVQNLEGIINSNEKPTLETRISYLAKFGKLKFIYEMFDDAIAYFNNIVEIEDNFCINQDMLEERQNQGNELTQMLNNLAKCDEIFIKANKVFLSKFLIQREALDMKMERLYKNLGIFEEESEDENSKI